MQTISKGRLWGSYVLSAIPILLLLMGAAFDLSGSPQAVQGAAEMGYPANTVPILGALALLCAVVYAIPRTAVLGAILMSAYFGAAVAPRWSTPLLDTAGDHRLLDGVVRLVFARTAA